MINNILQAKNKICLDFPKDLALDPSRFGNSLMGEILNFGFAYVESEDSYVEYIVCDPNIMRGIIIEVPEVELAIDKKYFGKLWTAAMYITNKIKNYNIIFANTDLSVVLYLNTNKILKEVYNGHLRLPL